jgi:lipopolysaccharide/colanic/teichoic acid biosynthesis glycosyltransferase
VVKRTFDIVIAMIALLLGWWLILLAWMAASVATRQNGLFVQDRVGRNGRIFPLIKIRTMSSKADFESSVTTAGDPRVSRLGWFLRRSKIDELPQLINVLLGQMSFVGPRPDVVGFADRLVGEDQIILLVRPGITGPATIEFRNEEQLLELQPNPERYNREVIFPRKVELNRRYVEHYSFAGDLGYLWETFLSTLAPGSSRSRRSF